MSGAGAASAASEPPVMLPAVSVVESLMKVNVVTTYHRFPIGAPAATTMMVREVKVPSFAHDAGLRKGMEIVAIEGKTIAGLSQGEVERLLSGARKDFIVLLVRGGGKKKPEEIRISLKPPPEETAEKKQDD